ncbi:MAG: 3'-5' exonuclease, partial [Nanoarchaeota archaeon]|nr:3'-5' exonuclease [Nanoarchaeota archaeon]
MEGFIVYPTYRVVDGKAHILLFGRLTNGESFLTINEFKPYFWVRERDSEKAQKILKELDAKNITVETSDFKNFDDEPVAKVTLTLPGEVPELRKIFMERAIPSYEADIRFAYRFLIDYDIKAGVSITGTPESRPEFAVDKVFFNPEIAPAKCEAKLRVLSIDIETDMKASNIYAISLYSERVKKVLLIGEGTYKNAETFKTEKEMLEAFANAVREEDPDVITGWNLIDFDIKVIRERFNAHQIPFILGRTLDECKLRIQESFYEDSTADFPGRAVLDGLRLLKMSFIKLDDYKLNTAAKAILGQEKLLVGDQRFEEIERLQKEDPQKL